MSFYTPSVLISTSDKSVPGSTGCHFHHTSFLVCCTTSLTSGILTGQGQKSLYRLVCLALILFCQFILQIVHQKT